MNGRRSSPTPDPEMVARAMDLVQSGHLAEAERIFRHLLRAHPDRMEFQLSLVAIARDAGRLDEALDRLGKALSIAPGRVDLHLQKGAVLFQLDRVEEAVAEYRRAVDLAPGSDEVHDILGVALLHAGRIEEALAEFARVVEIRPECAQAHMNLGATLHELDRLEDAVHCYRRALELDPNHSDAHENLGKTLYLMDRSGKSAEATRIAGEWRRDFPDNPWAGHLGAALGGGQAPGRASDEYLRAEFDGCAAEFEERLTALGYCAPQVLAEAMARELPPPDRGLQILDLGCGTGWGGRHLRAFARRMVGLDVAPQILARARATGIYDELVAEEMGGYLRAHAGTFDVIFAADVIPYSGGLDQLFREAAAALRPGGTFVFTAEGHRDGAEFRLNPSGRYSHTTPYLRGAVARAGLSLLALFTGQGRSEGTATGEFTYVLTRRCA